MKRRIISIISVLAVICSLIQVPVLAAKTSVDETKLTVLKNLDILGDGLPTKVTYNTFVNALMGYVLEGEARALYTPETFVKSSGMIEEDEEYKGSSAISFDDAIKYSVILLGYTSDLIPGINYKKIAGSENLLKGVAIDGTLKPADMVTLLYNLLDAEPLTVDTMSEKGAIYTSSADNTLLSMYRNIYECNGIVIANEYTSIYSDRGAGEDRITIGNYTFEIGYEYDRELLGCNVTSYIKDDGENGPWVKYLYEQEERNKKFIIWDEDILSINDRYTIVEYEDERGRVDKIKLAEHPKVIINGVFYGDYTKANLMPENGYVEFIDNNGDGKYEIVGVKSYKTIIVDSINIDKKIIKNKYSFNNDQRSPLELDNVEYSIKKAGEEITLADIAIGDVLSVAMSRGTSNRVCEIIVSSERNKFTVSGIRLSEREIYDGKKLYLLSRDYIRHLDFERKDVKLGTIYEFYMDAFGKIVYSKTMSEDAYALFFRPRRNEEDEPYIEYLGVDGEWSEAKLAKKVTLNSSTESSDNMYEVLRNMDPQMVELKINADGYVKNITTATETPLSQAKLTEGRFTKTPETAYIYRPIYNTFENILYLKNSARLFVMPREASNKYNKEEYYVIDASSYFVEAEFTVCAYNVDRYGYSDLFTIKGSNEGTRMPDSLFVVTGVTQVVDSYGDACERLEGCGNGYKDISFLTSGTGVLSGIGKGDVINFMLDKSGRVNTVSQPIVRLQDPFTKHIDAGTDFYPLRNIRATISEVDFENGRIILNYGTEEVTFPFTSSINCMEYNKTSQECDLINYDSFVKEDTVLVVTKHYGIKDMIRICD